MAIKLELLSFSDTLTFLLCVSFKFHDEKEQCFSPSLSEAVYEIGAVSSQSINTKPTILLPEECHF